MKLVATKTADQLDLQALHRVRERLVSQHTDIINQSRASSWNVALRYDRDSASCAPSCRASQLTFTCRKLMRIWPNIGRSRSRIALTVGTRAVLTLRRRINGRFGPCMNDARGELHAIITPIGNVVRSLRVVI